MPATRNAPKVTDDTRIPAPVPEGIRQQQRSTSRRMTNPRRHHVKSFQCLRRYGPSPACGQAEDSCAASDLRRWRPLRNRLASQPTSSHQTFTDSAGSLLRRPHAPVWDRTHAFASVRGPLSMHTAPSVYVRRRKEPHAGLPPGRYGDCTAPTFAARTCVLSPASCGTSTA